MRRDRIDLVHAHLFGDSLHSFIAARAAGRLPLILTLHGMPQAWNRPQRIVYPWLLSHCDRAIACGDSVRREVLERHPAVGRILEVVPNGIEAPRPPLGERAGSESRLGVTGEDVVIAGIGRLAPEKGFDRLISAFALLCRTAPEARVRLFLLGDGELRAELERQAVAEGVADRTAFAGFRPDVVELLAAIDVVVFSSLHEGLPIALLEAMAASRCIVATRIPGYLDAVEHDREALIAPAADTQGLAHALIRATTEPSLRERLGRCARQRFIAHFRAEAMVERYEAIYREVTGGSQLSDSGRRRTPGCAASPDRTSPT
jgi:glycosyltransferase involved in cell wall biosynthesis